MAVTLFNINLFSQAKSTILKYIALSNGLIDSSKTLEIIYSNKVCYLSGEDAKVQEFIDYKRRLVVDIMEFDNKKYKTIINLDSLPKEIKTEASEKLLAFQQKSQPIPAFQIL